jgi:hypothetical protein
MLTVTASSCTIIKEYHKMQWLNATVSGVGLIPLDPFFAIGDIHV